MLEKKHHSNELPAGQYGPKATDTFDVPSSQNVPSVSREKYAWLKFVKFGFISMYTDFEQGLG